MFPRRARFVSYNDADLIRTLRYVQAHIGDAVIQRYVHETHTPKCVVFSTPKCASLPTATVAFVCGSVDQLIARDDETRKWLEWCAPAIKAHFAKRPPFLKTLWRMCEVKRFQLRRWEWDGLSRGSPNIDAVTVYECTDENYLHPVKINTRELLHW